VIGVAAVAVPFVPTLEPAMLVVSVAPATEAAGIVETGEEVAVGVTNVNPVPEEIHIAPLG
jgi:hypothetical protein